MKAIKGGKGADTELDDMLKQMANLINPANPVIVPNNTGVKYSALLLKLIDPYLPDPIDEEQLERLLDIAVAAWNLAVYQQKSNILYRTYLAAVMSSGEMNKKDEKLLKKMQQDKEAKFSKYDTLLQDFEINVDDKGMSYVNVFSKPSDEVAQEMLLAENMERLVKEGFADADVDADENDDYDEDDELPDYVLPVIDRHAVVIKPLPHFLIGCEKHFFRKSRR